MRFNVYTEEKKTSSSEGLRPSNSLTRTSLPDSIKEQHLVNPPYNLGAILFLLIITKNCATAYEKLLKMII